MTGGKLVRAAWKQVLRATTFEGHYLSVHGIRYAAITLVASMPPSNEQEERLASRYCNPGTRFPGFLDQALP